MTSQSRPASRLSILIALPLALLVGCQNDGGDLTDPETSVGPTPGMISGTVRDATGAPIADASIILTFEIPAIAAPATDKARTTLRFSLDEPAYAKVWIGDYCDDATVRLLHEGPLEDGIHEFVWDGTDDTARHVLDGVYWVHIRIGDQIEDIDLLLARNTIADDAVPDEYRRLATTDAAGRFAFKDTCLGFGHEFVIFDLNGEPRESYTISRNVRVWALHDDYSTGSTPELVFADPARGLDVEITMPD